MKKGARPPFFVSGFNSIVVLVVSTVAQPAATLWGARGYTWDLEHFCHRRMSFHC